MEHSPADHPIRIVGDAGLAREMVQLVRVVFDETAVTTSIDQEYEIKAWGRAVLGLGRPVDRLAAFNRLRGRATFPTLVHPQADVGDTTRLGQGVVVTSGVVTTTDVMVGAGTLLNWNVTIGHDVQLGDCCVINPGASISGGVKVGSAVLVGTGANVIEGLVIGDGATVGAGAVVTRDVPPGLVVVGNPARVMVAK